MDYVSGDSEVDSYDNYEYVLAPSTPEFLEISKLKVFYYNHVPRPPTTTNDVLYQRICTALSAISFHDQFVFAQFWAAIEFGTCTVLTTRGQPFGVSVYTKEFWSYRIACLDHNSYVYHKENEKKVCIGPPARVFLTCSPELIQDVGLYNDKTYPQRSDALLSKIRGSLAMAVIECNRCKGVVEIVMTNYKDNFLYEMHQVCRALEGVGLQSSADRNENINLETYEHHPQIRSRETKSSCITRNALTNLFGLPKADAAERCGLKVGAFRDLHHAYGIKEWPCKSRRIVQSSAHIALINGSASKTISHDARVVIKDLESRLMQDNDDINYDGDIEYMDCLIPSDLHLLSLATADGDHQRIGEQPVTSPSPVLLQMYLPQ